LREKELGMSNSNTKTELSRKLDEIDENRILIEGYTQNQANTLIALGTLVDLEIREREWKQNIRVLEGMNNV
jgi:hypothetical protein